MKLPAISDKNLMKLKFTGFFASAVLLCVIILSSFWKPVSITPAQEVRQVVSDDKYGAQQLLMIDQSLHAQWTQLEQLYIEYALSLADASKKDNSNAVGRQVMEAEVSYAKVLDSVSAKNSSSPIIVKIDSTVNSYRAALQNRQTLNNNIHEIVVKNAGKPGNMVIDDKYQDQQLNDLKSDLVVKNNMITQLQAEIGEAATIKNNLSVNEQKLLQLQKDIQTKNDMIAKLQSQVNTASSKTTGAVINEQKVRQLQVELQSKTEMIATLQSQLKAAPVKNGTTGNEQQLRALQKELQVRSATITKLQNQVKTMPAATATTGSPASSKDLKKITDELEFLKWALRSEVSSNHALTENVNKLKQANANLTNQLKDK